MGSVVYGPLVFAGTHLFLRNVNLRDTLSTKYAYLILDFNDIALMFVIDTLVILYNARAYMRGV